VNLPRQCGKANTFLNHQCVDVDHAVLNQVQREHTDLVILSTVADHLAATGKEHEIGGAVPLLDHVLDIVEHRRRIRQEGLERRHIVPMCRPKLQQVVNAGRERTSHPRRIIDQRRVRRAE